MRRDILILIVVVVIIAAAVLVVVPLLFGPASAEITSVSTDRDLYHSNEVMHIMIGVNAAGNLENTTMSISGIVDSHGNNRLSHEMAVPLSPGPAVLTYDYQLPPCSHCAGLDPGPYEFNVTLLHDGIEISRMAHSVDIEQ
ncbi:hypothetical protein J2741_002350 [Methanolinea mesophila]|uniref:hypothetical protein n=1 Tax=Methanolinea mesophila TaxID=547055 RepID=UPI001AE64FB2|nr:hypothetical protein [Methanolinea mesophila]MBP1929754.1 hypothetical protein [Methanolinea mesophila]